VTHAFSYSERPSWEEVKTEVDRIASKRNFKFRVEAIESPRSRDIYRILVLDQHSWQVACTFFDEEWRKHFALLEIVIIDDYSSRPE
jgi:hypothetical protein